jgi:hypothetical protein
MQASKQASKQAINFMEHSPSWETDIQSVKKFPAFYGMQRFITVFTGARSWSLPLLLLLLLLLLL